MIKLSNAVGSFVSQIFVVFSVMLGFIPNDDKIFQHISNSLNQIGSSFSVLLFFISIGLSSKKKKNKTFKLKKTRK
jgi:uncharacterized transporter YbjL